MTYSDSLVRLKIDEAFPEGRGEAQGRAPACIPAGYALSARPCASPRPCGNASAIFSRTRESL